MSLNMGQLHVGAAVGSAGQIVLYPGPATVVLQNSGTQTAYIGMGTAVSATNGFPLVNGLAPFPFPVNNGVSGGTISAIVPSGTCTIGWMLSTPAGAFPTGNLG